MTTKYLRYRHMYENYYYSGMVDHLPEFTVLDNYKLTLNAIYRFMGWKDGKIELSTQKQLQEMDHPLPKKDGNLVDELLKPFDSNGDDIDSILVDPVSLIQWIPSLGDEVYYDGQYHVIVETENDRVCTNSKNPLPKGIPGPLMLGKAEENLKNLRHYRHDQSHRLHIYPIGSKPLYGEGFGADLPFIAIDDLPFVDFSIHTKLIPVLGRSRVDLMIKNGTVSPYRQHCGYRGRTSIQCIDASNSPLENGKFYTLNSIDMDFRKVHNVVITLETGDVVCNSSRFKYVEWKPPTGIGFTS